MTEKKEPQAQGGWRGRGPTIIDAAIKALELAGRPLSTQELIPKMRDLGWRCRGDEYYTVFGALARDVKKEGGRLAKAGRGAWTLRDLR